MTFDEAKFLVAFMARNVDTYGEEWLHKYDFEALERSLSANPSRDAAEKEIVRLWKAAKTKAAA